MEHSYSILRRSTISSAGRNRIKATYGGPLDGADRVLTRLDRHSIENTLKRNGQLLDR